MDFRILASILPVTPMLLVGAPVVLKFTEQLMRGYNLWQNNLIIICYVFGFLGVIGLSIASLERTYRDPLLAGRTKILLIFGFASAVLCVVLALTAGIGNKLIPIVIIFCVASPVVTGSYVFIKLRKVQNA